MQRSTSNVQLSTSNREPAPRRSYDLEERLLDYAVRIVRLSGKVPRTRAGNHIARQLLKSGTSPLPNHGEAQAAESGKDSVHKMRICLKELRESRRWLRLAQRVPLLKRPADADEAVHLVAETEELIKIFHTSIRTADRNRAKSAAKLAPQPDPP